MDFIQSIKNYMGNYFGYTKCPINGNTFWRSGPILIPYSEGNRVLVSLDGLRNFSKEEVAKKVFENANNLREGTIRIGCGRMYSIEEIVGRVPRINKR